MVHTTSRCCSPLISIASRLSIEHGRAGKVTSNCSFKNHIIQSLEQFIQRNRPTDIQTKKNITLKGTLHWYVEFLLLKYPLLVSFRLPHEDTILPKKTKNKNQTPKKHYYYRIGKNKIKSCKSLNDYKATYYIQNQTIERKHKTIEEKRNVTKAK
jgi:hypothetical protein